MSLPCGCVPRWLTEISVPVPVTTPMARPCTCCEAAAGKRCVGGAAGFLPAPRNFAGAYGTDQMAYADLCPARLEGQLSLGGVA